MCETLRTSLLQITPAEAAGEALGLAMAFGGSQLFTLLDNGNLKQVAVMCGVSYLSGRLVYRLCDCFFMEYRQPAPLYHQRAIPSRDFLRSINNVLKFVFVGIIPGYIASINFPLLTLRAGALYIGGLTTPFAIMSVFLNIYREAKREVNNIHGVVLQI